MKYLHYFLILALITFSLAVFASDEGPIVWPARNLEIRYDEKAHEYLLTTKAGEKRRYARHRYQQLIAELQDLYKLQDPELFESLSQHALLSRLAEPTAEEILEQGLRSQELALAIIDLPSSPCAGEGRVLKTPSQYSLDLTPQAAQGLAHLTVETELAGQGFFPLGKLLDMQLDLMSNNDNPLHGLSQGMGWTEYNKGIDGDDRGNTFGIAGGLKLNFEEAEISLRRTSQGYGRLAPQPRTYTVGGKEYTTYVRKDPSGKHYLEFLSVDGLELEVKRELGFNDLYVRVAGKREVLSDQGGLSQKLQDRWHKLLEDQGVIQYHYLNHREREVRYSTSFVLGKDLTLYESDKAAVRSDVFVGAGLSTNSDFHNVAAGFDLRIQRKRFGDDTGRYPTFEARVYGRSRVHVDKERDHAFGVELTGRMQVTKNGFIFLRMGVAHEEDRYSRLYGAEERERRGKLDLQHYLGAGVEVRF